MGREEFDHEISARKSLFESSFHLETAACRAKNYEGFSVLLQTDEGPISIRERIALSGSILLGHE